MTPGRCFASDGRGPTLSAFSATRVETTSCLSASAGTNSGRSLASRSTWGRNRRKLCEFVFFYRFVCLIVDVCASIVVQPSSLDFSHFGCVLTPLLGLVCLTLTCFIGTGLSASFSLCMKASKCTMLVSVGPRSASFLCGTPNKESLL